MELQAQGDIPNFLGQPVEGIESWLQESFNSEWKGEIILSKKYGF